jgi:hypothetical protein
VEGVVVPVVEVVVPLEGVVVCVDIAPPVVAPALAAAPVPVAVVSVVPVDVMSVSARLASVSARPVVPVAAVVSVVAPVVARLASTSSLAFTLRTPGTDLASSLARLRASLSGTLPSRRTTASSSTITVTLRNAGSDCICCCTCFWMALLSALIAWFWLRVLSLVWSCGVPPGGVWVASSWVDGVDPVGAVGCCWLVSGGVVDVCETA